MSTLPGNRRECSVFSALEPRAEREFLREKGLGGVLWGIGVTLDVRSLTWSGLASGAAWRGLCARTWRASGADFTDTLKKSRADSRKRGKASE